jgi:hypothetical protein
MLVVCEHQESLIAENLAEARWVGEQLKLTEAERARLGISTIASIDATPEQYAAWGREFIRLVFLQEGRRCRKCGHKVSGKLPHSLHPALRQLRQVRAQHSSFLVN